MARADILPPSDESNDGHRDQNPGHGLPPPLVLGQPDAGQIKAVCKVCGSIRVYPAVLDDLDPGVETETRNPSESVATAAGGARPSSTALLSDRET